MVCETDGRREHNTITDRQSGSRLSRRWLMVRGCVLSWRLSRSGKCVAGMNINFQSVENEACTLSKKFNKGELGMTRIRKYHKYGNKEREGGSTTDVKQTVCVGFSIYLLAVVLLPARCRTHRSLLQTFKPFRNKLVSVCLLSWGDSSPETVQHQKFWREEVQHEAVKSRFSHDNNHVRESHCSILNIISCKHQ